MPGTVYKQKSQFLVVGSRTLTAQKMKFSIKDFFSKCNQIGGKLRIWSHLLKKSLIENFICCAVTLTPNSPSKTKFS